MPGRCDDSEFDGPMDGEDIFGDDIFGDDDSDDIDDQEDHDITAANG